MVDLSTRVVSDDELTPRLKVTDDFRHSFDSYQPCRCRPGSIAIVFDAGAAKLIVEQETEASADARVGRFSRLSFKVADATVAHDMLRRRGVVLAGAPDPQYWGGTLVHFEDPDRNVLTWVQYPN